MALTQEQRDKLRKQFFDPRVTTSVDTDVQARINRIESIGTSKEEPKKEEGFFSKVGGIVKEGGEKIKETFKRAAKAEQTPLETGVQTVGTVIGTGFDIGFEAAKKVLDVIDFTDKGEEILGKAGKAFTESEIGKQALNAISQGTEKYDAWAKANPRAAANIEGLGNILSVAPVGKATQSVTKAAQKGAKIAEKTIQKTTGTLVEKIAEKVPAIGVKKIEKIISLKPDKSEVRRALSEGRVVRTPNKVFKLLGAKDKIQTEKAVKEAADVIKRRIPGASGMSDQEILTLSKKQISQISKELEPKLKMVKIDDTPKENILNSWADLKTNQIEKNVLLSESELAKAQSQFEKVLSDVIDADNADDLWKAVQKYDNTVSQKIKDAAEKVSGDKALELKDIWLDNRRILRNSIDDVSDIIGDDAVKNSFKDMTGLYTGVNNIIANANFYKGNDFIKKLLLGAVGVEALGSLID